MPFSNPYIDALDGLPDGSKQALALAHITATAAPQQQPMQALAGPMAQPLAQVPQQTPGSAPAPQAPTAGLAQPAQPASPAQPIQAPQRSAPMNANVNEMNRLESSPSGVGGLKHAGIRIPLQILDAIGGGLVPGIEQRLPGTEGHHEQLVRTQRGRVTGDEKMLDDSSKRTLEAAQATNQYDLPESRELTAENNKLKTETGAEVAAAKLEGQQTTAAQVAAQRDSARKAQLHQHGYDEDINGNIVPLAEEDLSQQARSALDDKRSLQTAREAASELSAARQELVKAQTSNIPAQLEVARQRLKSAEASHSIALERLNLSERQTEARLHGTENGVALPGALTTDSGDTVGSMNAPNVRPTATQRDAAGRADTMTTIEGRIRAALQHPELVKGTGPLAGRLSEAQGRLGTLPRELSELRNDLVSYGAFQAGLHPVRGIGALQYFDKVMGGLGQNPEELLGKLDSNAATAKSVKEVGAPKTVGSREMSTNVPEPVAKALKSVGPGIHKLSDGSTWLKDASGKITKQ